MSSQKMVENNVLVPPSAFDALEEFTATNGFSRDQAIRLILRDHIDQQLALDHDDRITHISTVIRHPAPPANRTETSTGHRLRLRLPPEMADEARAVALFLPGQATGRAYRDYQARPLADAVITAIAKVQPFYDDVLRGLLPLVRHRSAHSLWRLTAEGTRTSVERHTLGLTDARGKRIAQRLSEDQDEVAWRGPWRDEVMRHLVQRLLSGPNAQTTEEMLYRRIGLEWDDLVVEVRDPGDDTNLVVNGWPNQMRDYEGRGGAAVWRAARTVDLEDLRAWLTGTTATRRYTLQTPGWTLRMPAAWRTLVTTRGSVPHHWSQELARGKVLEVYNGSKVAIWPVLDEHNPVPGFSTILDAAQGLEPHEVIELALMRWDDDLMAGPLLVAAHRARNLGLIDTTTRDQLVHDARERTRANMKRFLDQHTELAPKVRQALEESMDNPSHFAHLARGTGVLSSAVTVTPQWEWHFGSVSSVLASGASAHAVQWLVKIVARRRQRALEASMEDASKKAFHQAHQEWMSDM